MIHLITHLWAKKKCMFAYTLIDNFKLIFLGHK